MIGMKKSVLSALGSWPPNAIPAPMANVKATVMRAFDVLPRCPCLR